MKTRRVIQKLKVKDGEFIYEGIGYGSMGVEREKFPDGTKAELAVYVDSPPKRELVVPEGVKWITSNVYQDRERLIQNDVEIAMVQRDGGWCIQEGDDLKRAKSLDAAKQACIEAMATANINGFSWKTIEPDWSRYDVVTIWYKTKFGWTHYMTSEARMNAMLLESFEHFRKPVYFAVSLEGRLPDGSVEIIDRWEKEEKGK